jgi:hypothetical protein
MSSGYIRDLSKHQSIKKPRLRALVRMVAGL